MWAQAALVVLFLVLLFRMKNGYMPPFGFLGMTDEINPDVKSAELVRDRVLSAAKHIPVSQLGTTDDCGFSPFADDTGVSREIAFAKIKARVEGTKLAEKEWGLLTYTDVKRLERPSGSPFLEKPLN